MTELNIYEAPKVLILELEKEDIITTSVGDGGAGNIGDENWDW